MAKAIVFIHGMYMTPLCWERWLDYFRSKGYHCHAPAWPGREKPIDELRRIHPDPELGRLTLSDVVTHMDASIKALGGKPVMIGHSMGGLVVQLLLQRDIAVAGVFIAKWSFVKSNWPHINPFIARGVPVQMTFPRFQYAFADTLPLSMQQAAFERYVVPESRRVPAESLSRTARIDFRRKHPPLLMIAGSDDKIIPASLNKTNFARYKQSPSRTDFKEFAGRTHFIIGQNNWIEIADHILTWLNTNGL
jgi:pimeloyl-ACP methyl ester carboxylesterase